MKCPVCDQENNTMLCPRCGFDASKDYALYPTFGPVGRVPSVSGKRKQWQDSQKKSISAPNGPQFVDYQKMVSLAAKAEQKKRDQLRKQAPITPITPVPPIPSTHYQELTQRDADIREASQREMQLIHSEIDHYQEMTATLESTLKQMQEENQRLQKELQTMRQLLDVERGAKFELSQKLKKLDGRIQSLDQENKTLAAELQDAHNKITELEANQNKGILGRLFNR